MSRRRRWPSAGCAAGGHAPKLWSLMRLAGAAPPRPGRGAQHPPPSTPHPAPSADRPLPPPPSTSSKPLHQPSFPPPVSGMACGHHSLARAHPLSRRRLLPPLGPPHATSRCRRRQALSVASRPPPTFIDFRVSRARKVPSSRPRPPPAVNATGARLPPAGGRSPACGRYKTPLLLSLSSVICAGGRLQPPPTGARLSASGGGRPPPTLTVDST